MTRILTPCALVLTLTLLQVGCHKKSQEKHPADPAPAAEPAANPAPSVAPAVPATPAAPPAPPSTPMAEVEITGTIAGAVPAARYVVVVTKDGCSVKTLLPLVNEFALMHMERATTFGMEIFIPQGTVGHFCAVAIDKAEKIVAIGAYAKNPVKMEGQGEVMVENLKLALKRLPKPVPAPKELLPKNQ